VIGKHFSCPAIFINQMLQGDAPVIFGDGNQVRDYVYVSDVAKANLLALRNLNDGKAASSIDDYGYNIGTSIGTTVNELYEMLKCITGFDKSAKYDLPRKGELFKTYLDITKARQELNFEPSFPLKEGLRATFEYFKQIQL